MTSTSLILLPDVKHGSHNQFLIVKCSLQATESKESDRYRRTLVGIKREYQSQNIKLNTEDGCEACAVKVKMSTKANDTYKCVQTP